MDKFKSNNVTEVPTDSVPKPPKKCDQCESEADVLSITVYDEMGQTHTGVFANYGNKKNGVLKLKDGYTYAHWNAACAKHYVKCREDSQSRLLREHWVKSGKPRTKEECLKAMYKINPGMAKLVGRKFS